MLDSVLRSVRLGRSDSVFELHVEVLQRRIFGSLLEVIVEHTLVEACKHITLVCQEYHLKILKMSDQEHASVHHVKETFIDHFVLQSDNLDDVLFDSKRNRDIEHF